MLKKAIILLSTLSVGILIYCIYKSNSTFNNNISIYPNIILPTITNQPDYIPTRPSLEQIFGDNHSWISSLSAQKVRVLIATGDVIPARSVNFQSTKYNDFKWAYNNTADVLRSADITLINLESPFINNCPLTNEGMIFCGNPRHIEGLMFAGVDITNLANNHLGNYGTEGINSTLEILKTANIQTTGISGATLLDVYGLRFAFLGYNDIGRPEEMISWASNDIIAQEIISSRKAADVIVVSFHWGVEYTRQPTARQRELAHLVIDSGADLVIGNHPHWIQPVEIYKEKLIVYAQGNFIFDQMWSEKTKVGVVGRYVFYDNILIDMEFLPIAIKNYGQPYFLLDEEKRRILTSMKEESIKLML